MSILCFPVPGVSCTSQHHSGNLYMSAWFAFLYPSPDWCQLCPRKSQLTVIQRSKGKVQINCFPNNRFGPGGRLYHSSLWCNGNGFWLNFSDRTCAFEALCAEFNEPDCHLAEESAGEGLCSRGGWNHSSIVSSHSSNRRTRTGCEINPTVYL